MCTAAVSLFAAAHATAAADSVRCRVQLLLVLVLLLVLLLLPLIRKPNFLVWSRLAPNKKRTTEQRFDISRWVSTKKSVRPQRLACFQCYTLAKP